MIKIYTFPDKRFDFINLQLKSLKDFCKDDFELIIKDDETYYKVCNKEFE